MKTLSYPSPILLLIVGAIFFAGCQTTPQVNTEIKPGIDFSRYKSFSILPLPSSSSASDPGLIVRVAGPARQAVADSLVSKGLAEAPATQADLSVHLHGQSVPKVDVTQLGYSRPVMTRAGTVNVVTNPDLIVNEYEQRTLTIEMLDNRSKEAIWAGWITKNSRKPAQVQDVTNAIHQILANFPPARSHP